MNENLNTSDNNSNSNYKTKTFEEIFKAISKISKKFYYFQRPIVRKLRLTIAQYFIMEYLDRYGKCHLKDLAVASYCSRSTITAVVDTMEKNKLISRETNPEDRRSLFVKLTEKGLNIYKSIPPNENLILELCKSFTSEEIEILLKLIKKLLNTLDSIKLDSEDS